MSSDDRASARRGVQEKLDQLEERLDAVMRKRAQQDEEIQQTRERLQKQIDELDELLGEEGSGADVATPLRTLVQGLARAPGRATGRAPGRATGRSPGSRVLTKLRHDTLDEAPVPE